MASITGAPPLLRSLLLGLCTFLLAFSFSSATPQTERIVAVVGNSECLDCAQKSIKNEEAFEGLHVAIKCKTGNEFYETKGVGLLDKSGSFDVQLPSSILGDDGELKDECFAQLRSASEAPCPDNNGVDQSKIVLKSKESGKHTFVVAAGKLPFSSACTSALYFKPHHKLHAYHKDLPKHEFKHKFHFHHHYFPPKPYFPPKKQLPLAAPVYKPTPVPKYKPPVPVYKPAPLYKPPIVKKPLPPVPIHKKPPIPKLPPLYHPHPKVKIPPIHKKPLPPIHKIPPLYHPHPKFKFPPIHKKPLPQIHKPTLLYHPHPEFHPIHKKPLPSIPKHPHFYHPHPKFHFPPKPNLYKKKPPIFHPVKEHPVP